MDTWQLQEAKARLSELVKRTASQGPQEITLHGRPVAVVLSREDFERLTGNARSLVDFMRESPLYGLDELEFPRDRSPAREVAL
ncbi:MAG: type II toxin-antitoxin system Phd/YefM family antitoxin [Burkholderiaceae bacterium]|nr:type II toxin-antitoxin system Phd/YefM family antitoxin [Burkholderiaceae bacterium]